MILKGGKMAKALREQKDLLQSEVADRIGVGQSHLSLMETGKNRPSLEVLQKWAEMLDFTMNEFIEGKQL